RSPPNIPAARIGIRVKNAMARKALPSRTQVLDVFEHADGALHTNEVAEKLGVPAEQTTGLLRLLDDLVFDGILVARGQRFKLESKGPMSGMPAPTPAPVP